MTRIPARIFIALAFVGLLGNAASNICPDANNYCDISHPVYVNVYWDSSVAQWNADSAANDPSATVQRIDALTAAICKSAYFSQLIPAWIRQEQS